MKKIAARNVIDQHVFRSPALIVADDHQTLILIPELVSATVSYFTAALPTWFSRAVSAIVLPSLTIHSMPV